MSVRQYAGATEAEILLTQIYERRDIARRVAFAEAQLERKLLGSMARALSQRSVITTTAAATQINSTVSGSDSHDPSTVKSAASALDEESADEQLESNSTYIPPQINAPDQRNVKTRVGILPVFKNREELDSIFGSRLSSDDEDEKEGHVIEAGSKRQVDDNYTGSAGESSELGLKMHAGPLLKKKATGVTSVDDDEDEVIIDLDTLDSSALYADGFLSLEKWDPIMATVPKVHILKGFGMVTAGKRSGFATGDTRPNNTLVVQLTVPTNAKRWAINIGPENHKDGTFIFLHFNPRYNKSKLVLNNKAGTWGAGRSVSMKSNPAAGKGVKNAGALIASTVELMISVRDTGFACFANGECCCFFPHRTDIRKLESLACILSRTDDNGVVENVVFQKVWWGFRDPVLDSVPQSILDVHAEEIALFIEKQAETQTLDTSTKLEVSGLPTYTDPNEVMALEGVVMSVFQQFSPTECHVSAGTGRCYVQFPSLETCLEALDEMQGISIDENGKIYDLEITRLTKMF